MRSVTIHLGARSYEARIAAGLLGDAGALVRQHLRGPRCAIISDENVAPLFGETVLGSLRGAGFAAALITIAAGERSKSFLQAQNLCEQLDRLKLDRTSFLVSLGGGVIGDLTGFVASIYRRGIPYLSLPTTLLAQVDSCIGGKTGVNSSTGKNLLGTFHHPALVLADTETLRTLPERIWNEGFAEAIKHGVIGDAALFSSIPEITRDDPAAFIERNIFLKAALVSEDEREQTGQRARLNFGHTIGHAIEHAAGYGEMLHGEAVSLGMVAAARISIDRAGLSLGEFERICDALRARELPVTLPRDFPREKIFVALLRDKKFENGRVRFVVVPEIGQARLVDDVTMEELRASVAQL